MNPHIRNILAAVLFLVATYSQAEENFYDRVSLDASATAPVANDILVGVLFAEAEGASAAAPGEKVNQDIAWALERSKSTSNIKVQTLNYNTQPVYRNQTQTGWRVRQSMRLESGDSIALSELLGELQSRLKVESISYTVSPEARETAENELIAEALAAFNTRAELIARELGRQSYKIVQINVSANRQQVPRSYARGMAMAEASMSAPALEAGEQTLEVSVSGTIEVSN